MNKFLTAALALTFVVAPASVLSVAPAMAASITGGNAVFNRGAFNNTKTDFSTMDPNNPINRTGKIWKWSIFTGADNHGPTALLIYRTAGAGYNIVGQSDLKTPIACPTGCAQTFHLAGGLAVQAGDFVGFYSQQTSSVSVSGSGSGVRVTASGEGISANFRPALIPWENSINVSNAPEPGSWAMFIAGFGMVGFAARRRRTVAAA
jgi:hypothetical protein